MLQRVSQVYQVTNLPTDLVLLWPLEILQWMSLWPQARCDVVKLEVLQQLTSLWPRKVQLRQRRLEMGWL